MRRKRKRSAVFKEKCKNVDGEDGEKKRIKSNLPVLDEIDKVEKATHDDYEIKSWSDTGKSKNKNVEFMQAFLCSLKTLTKACIQEKKKSKLSSNENESEALMKMIDCDEDD